MSVLGTSQLISQTAHLNVESFKPEIRTNLVKGEPGTGKTLLGLELLRRCGRRAYLSSRVSQEVIFDKYPELKTLFRREESRSQKPKAACTEFEDVRLADSDNAGIHPRSYIEIKGTTGDTVRGGKNNHQGSKFSIQACRQGRGL